MKLFISVTVNSKNTNSPRTFYGTCNAVSHQAASNKLARILPNELDNLEALEVLEVRIDTEEMQNVKYTEDMHVVLKVNNTFGGGCLKANPEVLEGTLSKELFDEIHKIFHERHSFGPCDGGCYMLALAFDEIFVHGQLAVLWGEVEDNFYNPLPHHVVYNPHGEFVIDAYGLQHRHSIVEDWRVFEGVKHGFFKPVGCGFGDINLEVDKDTVNLLVKSIKKHLKVN